ncbi:MAG: hypothetical protein JW867_06640 [Candidatus Omnitrophica bacterium]|nr:hypothetical protein [Candidatus Omnitrophota bacterium]
MRDNPIIVSLLIGLIVILVIACVSLLVKMNSLDRVYKQSLAKNISCEKSIEDLKLENSTMAKSIKDLQAEIEKAKEEYDSKIADLKNDNLRLQKLKEKLEDDLKDELMKQEVIPQ